MQIDKMRANREKIFTSFTTRAEFRKKHCFFLKFYNHVIVKVCFLELQCVQGHCSTDMYSMNMEGQLFVVLVQQVGQCAGFTWQAAHLNPPQTLSDLLKPARNRTRTAQNTTSLSWYIFMLFSMFFVHSASLNSTFNFSPNNDDISVLRPLWNII